ncbi:PREDICTED: protein DCL, chloroplastic-like isoform X4 [Populus euphratica]|uniref:Protein DCL, chloroplastic-like isoform X3 n=1 Tax=Populus euphratica TaxID=75702 RepID=A0AAJ6UVQ5_POPEU|nr:PREDICTED: protein DCL, chloroplastic-like isoform X3 [Populus euphratica]XP_011036795.1 PREDICTED: protein DCL, chloroplastic-like isoform X4 [Populus euphratica]
MAEEIEAEAIETNLERADTATEEMDMVEDVAANGAKRAREGEEEDNEDVAKKQKVDKSVEEERLEKLEGEGTGEGEEKKEKENSGPVSLGPKSFASAVEMFDYFYNLLHYWPPNLNVNKYEQMVLLELLKRGHTEPDKKIGGGIQTFQVRFHPMFKSRCFFLIRDDESVDDFSFRKCVDHILPLPEDMKIKSDNFLGGGKGHGGKGGHGGRGGRGRGRGYGRGGRSRN